MSHGQQYRQDARDGQPDQVDTRSRARLGTDADGNETASTGFRKYLSSSMLIYLRYSAIAALALLGSLKIFSEAYDTTVVHRADWEKKTNEELLREDIILPVRGEILADDNSVLATNLTFYTLRMDFQAASFREKQFLQSMDSLCDSLAKYYPVRDADGWKKLFNRELGKDKKKRSKCLTLLRDISFFEKETIRRTWPFYHIWSNPNKTGLTIESRERRSYPYGEMARRSIGRVGQTKECAEVHGISGLEKALDTLLYGKPGKAKKVPLTHKIANWTDIPARDGYTLRTTINVGIQDIVDRELNAVLSEIEADWGAAILMEASTGDIKAISNLERDSLTGNYQESMYHVLQGFEPGSVMKTISMVVALEDGFVSNLDQVYSIGGGFVFGAGKAIKDTHSPATLTVRQFLEYSSNIGMTKLVAPHFADNPNGFRERLRQMGLLDRFNTGIAGEEVPYFPPLDLRSGGLTTLGRQTYGYGSRISPLYMCAFYNAIANDGRFVRPRIVSALRMPDGTDSILPVTYVRDRICSAEHARQVREMLRRVIYEKGGTAKMLKSDMVEICGKTGTAKLTYEITPQQRKAWAEALKKARTREDSIAARPKIPGGYREGHYRLAFCGIFPYGNPKYTCMVLISNPKPGVRSAGYTSGMVLKRVAEKLYSRGLLDNSSNYRFDADGTPVSARGAAPVLYAGMDSARRNLVKSTLGTGKAGTLREPAPVQARRVPDVRGLSVRDALQRLETAGYRVHVRGSGYVAGQTPAPQTPARPGTTVTLNLDTYTYR